MFAVHPIWFQDPIFKMSSMSPVFPALEKENTKTYRENSFWKNVEEKPVIPYTIITGFTFVNHVILCWHYL